MGFVRTVIAYLAAAMVTFLLGAGFYTQQILAKQAEIGAVYTPTQQLASLQTNLVGLAPTYGVILSIALLLGFVIAWAVKRILTPLAPIAYPVAGAAAVFTALYLIENVLLGGGVGAIGGARGALGMTLQSLAGFAGGLTFAVLRPSK